MRPALRRGLTLAASVLVLGIALDALARTILTVGKTAVFATRGASSAVVRFGRDPAFASPVDPTFRTPPADPASSRWTWRDPRIGRSEGRFSSATSARRPAASIRGT